MTKYKIRFNQQHDGSDLKWKVFTGDQMFLAKEVIIKTTSWTECSKEGEEKFEHWNIYCVGELNWSDTIAIIE